MVEDGYELSYNVGYEITMMLMENPLGRDDNSRPILGGGAINKNGFISHF